MLTILLDMLLVILQNIAANNQNSKTRLENFVLLEISHSVNIHL